MNITEVRIKLMGNQPGDNDRLRAFATFAIDDCFVVHDAKVIDLGGRLSVCMPCRRIKDPCPKCSEKNHLSAGFCGRCGAALDPGRATRGVTGRVKMHADVAHPTDAATRLKVEDAVLAAYLKELARAAAPAA